MTLEALFSEPKLAPPLIPYFLPLFLILIKLRRFDPTRHQFSHDEKAPVPSPFSAAYLLVWSLD